jgi:hypothetical protein
MVGLAVKYILLAIFIKVTPFLLLFPQILYYAAILLAFSCILTLCSKLGMANICFSVQKHNPSDTLPRYTAGVA